MTANRIRKKLSTNEWAIAILDQDFCSHVDKVLIVGEFYEKSAGGPDYLHGRDAWNRREAGRNQPDKDWQ